VLKIDQSHSRSDSNPVLITLVMKCLKYTEGIGDCNNLLCLVISSIGPVTETQLITNSADNLNNLSRGGTSEGNYTNVTSFVWVHEG
jgi:hypothetical protein